MDMHETTKTYHADRELTALLEAAAAEGEPLRVEGGGVTYAVRVARSDDDMRAGYDPARVRATLRKFAGSWSDLDADELKSALYRARDVGSRSIDRS